MAIQPNRILSILALFVFFLCWSVKISAQVENDTMQNKQDTIIIADSVETGSDTLFVIDSANARLLIDTLLNKYAKGHSPERAAMLSAVVPGMGQFYNKKYWKIPIIYVAYGFLGYYIWQNNFYYNQFRSAYFDFQQTGTVKYNEFDLKGMTPNLNEEEQLLKGIDTYQRWRDMNVIGATLLYFLNVIDATVDAHFFDYDVSNDLTLHIKPIIYNNVFALNQYGISCYLKLK